MVRIGRSSSRIWGVVLFLLTLVTVVWAKTAPAEGRSPDIQGHWAQPCMEALVQTGVMPVYLDGLLRPEATVTRAEFAQIIQRAFPSQKPVRPAMGFNDVGPDAPAVGAIQYAYQTGFLSPSPDGQFYPTATLPRAQALGVLATGLNFVSDQVGVQDLPTAFSDAQQIPAYTRSAVATALENGLIINYPSVRQLNPQQPMRRAELAGALCLLRPGLTALVPAQYVVHPPPVPSPTREIRGVWLTSIDSDVLFSRDRTRQAIAELASLNFNTIYPTVWNWGYTLYPSAVAQGSIGVAVDPRIPGLQGRDMLAEVVQQGHQHRMAVIPWFEFGFMAPADSELARRYPELLTQRQNGDRVWMQGTDARVWLNPFKPEVQGLLGNLILEVVDKYAIDGIQLDDHFSLPNEFGYDPFTVQLYQKQHEGKSPPTDPTDPEWIKWRADQLTEFMKLLVKTVKQRKPNLIVSLSPNNYGYAYQTSLQDWRTWKQQKLIDELIVQAYRSDLQSFMRELTSTEVQEANQTVPTGIGILTGLRQQGAPIRRVRQQVNAVRRQGLAGFSFFFYESLWNLTEEPTAARKPFFQTIFPTAVPRPS
ncbi:MAG: family 10 glycosylhydrolase [Leptolyngbyaceae cyanobacterium]